ncbi:hypothetical protein [Streptomyces sp. NPDC017940]|uniref:hypothetical protein n=1 Tax=Streptomyces sp. NPDC017940 TaxID=3365017 RepID=UPI0037ABFFA2
MADETSIKVSAETRDRLAALAVEQGTTIRRLVEDLAVSQPTRDEAAQRVAQAREEVAGALGAAPSAEAEQAARALLERLGGHGPQVAA